MVVVLGASGSGTSTFLNMPGGLDTPTGGQVLFRGADIGRAGQRQLTEYRRRHIGFVFQFYNLTPSLTARENVSLVTGIAEPLTISEIGCEKDRRTSPTGRRHTARPPERRRRRP